MTTYPSLPFPVLLVPRLPLRTVHRTRLLRRLDRLAPVTLLDGPPGCGATTLLVSWCEQQRADGALTLWIGREPVSPDVDLVACVAGVLASQLGAIHPSDDGAGPASRIARALGTSGRRCIVVVDGADEWESQLGPLVDALAFTPNLHLVLVGGSRSRWAVQAAGRGLEVLLLTGDQLAATPDELAELVRSWGHELGARTLERLHRDVGGWIVPAQLALDAPSDGERYVLDHAVDYVTGCLDRELLAPSSDRDVLAALSLVRQVDAPLLEALLRGLGRSEVRWFDVVRRLSQRGTLVRRPGASGGGCWSVPEVVRLALEGRGVPTALRELVGRSLDDDLTLDRTVDLGRLVVQARRSEDWSTLRHLWASRGLELVAGHPEAASRAFGRLPVEVTTRMPALGVAGTVVGRGLAPADGEAVARRYVRAGRAVGARALDVAHPDDLAVVVAAAMVARRHDGDVDGALDVARWYEARSARDGARGSASQSARAWLELHHGRTQLVCGDLSGVIVSSEFSYGLGAERADSRAQSLAAAGQAALAATLLASSRDARRWLDVAARCPVPADWLGEWALLPTRVARAMVALDALDRAGAEEQLEALRSVAVTEELWPWAALVLTRYATLFGDPAAKVLWLYDALARRGQRHLVPVEIGVLLQRCTLQLHIEAGELTRAMAELESSPYPRGRFATADAKLQLLAGRETRSRAVAEAASRAPDTPGRERGGLLLLHAAAALRCGRVDEARRALRSAHAVIERTGMASAYATIPGEDLSALHELADPPPVSTEALRLLGSRQVARDRVVVLTPRELEVLRQSARHGSVAAVARALSVSVNTVKKQRVSLYAKLGVRDHHSAVLRGRQLGLVEP